MNNFKSYKGSGQGQSKVKSQNIGNLMESMNLEI